MQEVIKYMIESNAKYEWNKQHLYTDIKEACALVKQELVMDRTVVFELQPGALTKYEFTFIKVAHSGQVDLYISEPLKDIALKVGYEVSPSPQDIQHCLRTEQNIHTVCVLAAILQLIIGSNEESYYDWKNHRPSHVKVENGKLIT